MLFIWAAEILIFWAAVFVDYGQLNWAAGFIFSFMGSNFSNFEKI
jgi:hypothetical protein